MFDLIVQKRLYLPTRRECTLIICHLEYFRHQLLIQGISVRLQVVHIIVKTEDSTI
jgi:hypothetical protein